MPSSPAARNAIVNIGKRNNAAARQATSFGATALPYIRVYAPTSPIYRLRDW